MARPGGLHSPAECAEAVPFPPWELGDGEILLGSRGAHGSARGRNGEGRAPSHEEPQDASGHLRVHRNAKGSEADWVAASSARGYTKESHNVT